LQALGTLARQRGQAGEAKAFFDEAITMEQERGNPHMVAGLLRDLGLADADAGDTDAALAHLRQAHRVAVTVGDAETGGTALYDAAKLLLRTGDKAGARASALESAAVLREGGHPRADEVTAWLAGLDQSTAG
jgi:tetratricopeptide (TPR) repeat protein